MKDILFLILNKKNQKLIMIVDFLMNDERWYKINEIADFMGLSIRSTQRLVSELEDRFLNYNQQSIDTITLTFAKNNGVHLSTSNGLHSFWSFIRYIAKSDTAFQLARSIFFNTFHSPVQFADEHMISVTSVRSYLRKCQNFCHSLGISFSPTTYELIGLEEQIRIINYSITWFLNRGLFWPDIYQMIDESKLSDRIDRLVKDILGYQVIPSKRKKLTYFIAINLLRYRQKKYISMQPDWENFFNSNTDGTLQIVRQLYKDYYIYSEAEIYFLATYWQSEPKLYLGIDTTKEVLNTHCKQQSTIYQSTTFFCELFSKDIVFIPETSRDKVFQQAFFTHLNCSISKINDYFSYDTVLFEKNTNFVPSLTNKLSEFIEKLYVITKNEIFTNKEVLLRAYMAIYTTLRDLPFHLPTIYIYLETDLPYTEETYIKAYLYKHFHNSFDLSFVESDFTILPDLILSSLAVVEDSDVYCQIKLSANPQTPITLRSLDAIEEKMHQLVKDKYFES